MYSGNLGIKQGLDILPEAARRLPPGGRVRIVVCGQGAAGEHLREEAEKSRLPNFTLLPLQDDEAYHEMMADTDVCLITQAAGTGQYFFPSKLLSALASARPVLAVADADSELALALDEGNFGWRTAPGRADELAAGARKRGSGRRGGVAPARAGGPGICREVRVGRGAGGFRAGAGGNRRRRP